MTTDMTFLSHISDEIDGVDAPQNSVEVLELSSTTNKTAIEIYNILMSGENIIAADGYIEDAVSFFGEMNTDDFETSYNNFRAFLSPEDRKSLSSELMSSKGRWHECAINIGLGKKLEKFKKQEESKKQEISTEKKSRGISLKDMSPEDIARHIANQKAGWKKQAKQA